MRCAVCVPPAMTTAVLGVALALPTRLQPETVVPAAENLGEHLTGETIENSVYEVRGARNADGDSRTGEGRGAHAAGSGY